MCARTAVILSASRSSRLTTASQKKNGLCSQVSAGERDKQHAADVRQRRELRVAAVINRERTRHAEGQSRKQLRWTAWIVFRGMRAEVCRDANRALHDFDLQGTGAGYIRAHFDPRCVNSIEARQCRQDRA